MEILAIAAVLILAVAIWIVASKLRRSRAEAAALYEETMAAQCVFLLVVLRQSPAELEPEVMEAAARAAWSERYGTNADGFDFIDRQVPREMYVLEAHGNAFMVTVSERANRWLEPPTEFLPECAAGLWNDFTHDVSVGLVHDYDTDPKKLAAFVSTLTASLCDDRSIAVYHPASRRLWKFDESVRRSLANGSDAFFTATDESLHSS
ncbi:MAG: hypothetical protein KDE45_19090 [Caldilineaceae bacterium]|nr:hypothetical protein [Caldilineaceae bacterium]